MNIIMVVLTEDGVLPQLLAVEQHAVSEHALRLGVGIALGLPAEFADALHSSHLRPSRGVRLQELFRFCL